MNFPIKVAPKLLNVTASFVKHITVALLYVAVKYLFMFFSPKYTSDERTFWLTVIFIGTYFSTAFAFACYNKTQCLQFLEKNTKDIFPHLISFEFFADQAMAILFLLCFSVELKSPVAVAAVFVCNAASFIIARSIWLGNSGSKEPTHGFLVKLAVHICLSFPGLFLIFFLAASFIPSLPTLIMVARLVSYLLIIPLVLAVFLYIRALNVMRVFLKKLKRFCRDNKIKEPKIKHPYLSVFMHRPNNIFNIEIHGKVYSCNLISFTNIFRPVIFKSDGYFYRISARALKRKESPLLFFETAFGYESKYPKLVIIVSAPYVVKLQEGTLTRTFDTGDTCNGYKLFTPFGFFGAAERNTIARKSFD